jgi:isopenicillin-N N-acyltransferase like protein
MVPERFRMVTLAGSHHEIGRQHGVQLGDLVHRHLDTVTRRLESRSGLLRDDARAKALAYQPYVEQYTPELAEEIRGVADGADIPLGDAYILQLRAELTQPVLREELSQECTTFAILPEATATGEPIAGQNADLAPFYREVAAVVRIIPDGGIPVLMLTPAGQVSYIGINAAGLGVFANFLTCDVWRMGLPRYLYSRLMLRHTTVPEAVAAVASVRRASSRNLICIDTHGNAADIETTPTAHAVLEPEHGLLAHSNHYVNPSLQHAERVSASYMVNTSARLARMRELLHANRGKLSVDVMQAICRDRACGNDSICRHEGAADDQAMTFASVIAEPARGRLWVAVGPPDQHEYVRYDLEAERQAVLTTASDVRRE